jgi:voltage-gated potassium channel
MGTGAVGGPEPGAGNDMTGTPIQTLPPTERRRLIARGLLRALASTTVLMALYFLAPIDHIEGVPVGVSLAFALLVLLGVTIWQIRAITLAAHPGVRAIEALASTVPLFLLLFAVAYFLVAQDDPANFSTHTLTRTDALYFTVTIFATVGFGDITARSQTARLIVSTQMILDLLVLGLGLQVVLGAVQRGRQQAPDPSAATAGGS